MKVQHLLPLLPLLLLSSELSAGPIKLPHSAGAEAELRIDHSHQQEERGSKGGSFLCHPAYSESYRPSAWRGTPPDTGMGHIGFRCAISATAPTTTTAKKP